MAYTALYRKFRPATFEEVKGQDHIVTTLRNQVKADRIGHAYLFTGTRGTGKTSVAKIFARAVNCEAPVNGSPCGVCAACQSIGAGTSMNVVEIDAASNNGVDNIREIIDEVSYSPAEGKYKVYIIDEVHMLSTGAFNALLKTLEEPPSYAIFILATTEVHKIPITILSRCQRYDFRRMSIDTLAGRLREVTEAEGVMIEEKALRYLAKAADGSMRDGLSLLDQCIAFHMDEELTFDKVLDVLGAVDTAVFSQMVRTILKSDVAGTISLLEDIISQGRELSQFVLDLTWYLRNLLLLKTSLSVDDAVQVKAMEDILEVSADNLARLKEEAEEVDENRLLRWIRVLSELTGQLRYSGNKRVLTEIALIKLCRPQMETDTAALTDRVRSVEEKIEQGIVVRSGAEGGGTGSDLTGTAGKGDTGVTAARPPLPKATPEEVKEVIRQFPAIRQSTEGLMKTSLKAAQLSVSEAGELVIGIPDGYDTDYFIRYPEHVTALEDILEESVGRHVKVLVVPVKNEREFEAHYPDISEFIHMNLTEEE
ncbi:MAG: DNA polymerase III subunit gamma/tau [Lachnospiraceae bacterium]|nr:DNA polymerase III subunit gamma/tau [Lachnospiraceae bacterium]